MRRGVLMSGGSGSSYVQKYGMAKMQWIGIERDWMRAELSNGRNDAKPGLMMLSSGIRQERLEKWSAADGHQFS